MHPPRWKVVDPLEGPKITVSRDSCRTDIKFVVSGIATPCPCPLNGQYLYECFWKTTLSSGCVEPSTEHLALVVLSLVLIIRRRLGL